MRRIELLKHMNETHTEKALKGFICSICPFTRNASCNNCREHRRLDSWLNEEVKPKRKVNRKKTKKTEV